MATTTGREHRLQSRFETARALVAQRRRNLLLPILLLVTISLLAVAGLLYWSAGSLNRRHAVAEEALVRSMVQARKDILRQLLIDYTWWNDAVASFGVHREANWVGPGLPKYLRDTFRISAGWVVAPDGSIKWAFEDGRVLSLQEVEPLMPGVEALIGRARQAASIDAVPQAAFVLYKQELALIGASPVVMQGGASEASAESQDVIVFMRPLDLQSFGRSGTGEDVESVQFIRGPVPAGFIGCTIRGLDDRSLGSIIWHDHRPGDDLLWGAAPLLLVSLLAVGVLLFLTIKRVETVVSREGLLSISLYQEKQRRSQKSHFVSMVSHELRTPLQAIGTSADMLERFGDQMSEAERREETLTIRRAVATLARLVDDVLVMGRADAAPAGEATQPLDLARFCRAMWREVSVALRSKQEMVLHDRIGAPVEGVNQAAMHTILSNLMQNAIKYSAGQGCVEVELARENGHYMVAVTDFGPGISQAQREAIFQPYWRAKETEGITGTGLGLAVARSAARSMGGELALESNGRESSGRESSGGESSRGTRFVLRWPVEG